MIDFDSIESAEMGGSPVFYVRLPRPFKRSTMIDEMNAEGVRIDGKPYRVISAESFAIEEQRLGFEVGLQVEPA
jgi:hypothetical protein